jgi:hypothetical protein
MFSREYSPTFSRFVPDVNPTGTGLTFVGSLVSGSDPAYLTVPQGANIDGSMIPIFLSGRLVYHTGASPCDFTISVCQGTPSTSQVLGSLTGALPANKLKGIAPFYWFGRACYDVSTQTMTGIRYGGYDPSLLGWSNWDTFVLPNPVPPGALQFFVQYQFSVAPLAGTQVQITEFRFGL